MIKIDLEDGKYTYIAHDDGRQEALRYKESWLNLTGNNLVAAMGNKIVDLGEQVETLLEKQCDWSVIGEVMRKHGIEGDIAPGETDSQFIARIIDELCTKPTPAEQVMKQCGDNAWGECAQYPKSDWEYEVEEGNTTASYWDWVVSSAESDEVDLETLTGAAE